MTPQDKRILRSLIAVAWADGKMAKEEAGVLDGILRGFGASKEEDAEMREYAKKKRTLADVPVAELSDEDREILLGNAAVISLADGKRSTEETALLGELIKLLKFSDADAKTIVDAAADGAIQLGTRGLEDDPG